jgi:16S rRNA (guanine(966)-N(2))-methyltransferase RsmD
MGVRIIAGAAGGRRLAMPKGSRTRPTSDRIKEALFNILGSIDGKSFIDLFAGSGSVGLEALSRGASRAVFVEKSPAMAEIIGRHLLALALPGSSDIVAFDVRQGIKLLQHREETFDILFADPPYEQGLIDDTLEWIAKSNLIAADGLVVMQHSVREAIHIAGPLEIVHQRRYGDTILSFLKINEKEARNL